jgi:hypothetical protein
MLGHAAHKAVGVPTHCDCYLAATLLQAAAFAKAQIRTIGNAIKKLSSELYTKDVHFIMELVQVITCRLRPMCFFSGHEHVQVQLWVFVAVMALFHFF